MMPLQALEALVLFLKTGSISFEHPYLLLRTLTHKASGLLTIPQASFIIHAKLKSLAFLKPNPLSFFGLHNCFQLIRCIFLLVSEKPQMKFLHSLSILLQAFAGSFIVCVT